MQNNSASGVRYIMNNEFYINTIEDNLFKFSLYLGSTEEGCIYNGEDIKWVYTGGKSTNRIFPLQLNEENIDEGLSKVFGRFKAWNVSANLYVSSGTYPKNIKEHLLEHGIVYFKKWAGMAININGFSRDIRKTPDIKIVKADDAETIKAWSKIAGISFGVSEKIMRDMQKMYTAVGSKNDNRLFYYMGLKNGVPAATTLLFKDGDIAGLYMVGTLPEARGNGIAAAMVVHALKEAASMGCSVAILQASEMGKGVYDKIGFKEYCTIDIYKSR